MGCVTLNAFIWKSRLRALISFYQSASHMEITGGKDNEYIFIDLKLALQFVLINALSQKVEINSMIRLELVRQLAMVLDGAWANFL